MELMDIDSAPTRDFTFLRNRQTDVGAEKNELFKQHPKMHGNSITLVIYAVVEKWSKKKDDIRPK